MMWNKEKDSTRSRSENLIDTLFGDMKKMDSVIKRLQREINDQRIKTENVPKDMKSMDSILKELTQQVSDLRAQVEDLRRGD
tara:strand:+ start:244 stop:489 length:246 start_codon:yes stop_codon:yes gene_type:complete